MKLSQTCRCAGSFSVEVADDSSADKSHADAALADWRRTHRCIESTDDKRTGVGFAATERTAPIRHPYGHNTQEIRA